MKANELRIGNLGIDNLGGILKIKGINTDSCISHLRPITLTKEWLLRVGFEKGNDFLGDCFFIEIDKKQDFVLHIINGSFWFGYDDVNVTSVHQLQNLYFALTQQELTIKN